MKPESKKISEKKRLHINDDGGSSLDLNSLKEAINNSIDKALLVKTNVPTKEKSAFDLTSMSQALPSVDRFNNRKLYIKTVLAMKRHVKAVAEREAMKQRLLTLLMICDKYSCKN
ncbi:unnamed protein product [Arabidopsis halleri]